MMNNLASIILAAGKGTRFKSETVNKVVLPLGGKPMILRTVDFVKNINLDPIIVVVGFAKDSVSEVLKGKHVVFVEQKEQLGTGHAVLIALPKLPKQSKNVLVIQGDDAVFYQEGNIEQVKKLIDRHLRASAAVTFLTVELANPFGMGRIVRDEAGNVVSIVEHKDASEEHLHIREVNAACYIFRVDFLKKYLPKLKKQRTTGEYYLTDLIQQAKDNKEHIEAVAAGTIPWRSVNTQDELLEAEVLLQKTS